LFKPPQKNKHQNWTLLKRNTDPPPQPNRNHQNAYPPPNHLKSETRQTLLHHPEHRTTPSEKQNRSLTRKGLRPQPTTIEHQTNQPTTIPTPPTTKPTYNYFQEQEQNNTKPPQHKTRTEQIGRQQDDDRTSCEPPHTKTEQPQ
jgi:hypothetical protein